MASKQSLHMNHGGEASYARNSTLQSAQQNRMKPFIEEAVAALLNPSKSHRSLAISDMGCSSGPNAIALVSLAVEAISHHFTQQEPPELYIFVNDLPDTDFNNVAKRLDAFRENTQSFGTVVTSIVPGSFYKRLFISSSLHLVLSSSSVHWLSEAPEDLRKNGIPICDGDDDLRKARRPLVFEAYAQQFRKDFSLFLNLRAQELVPRGQMVISLPGRRAGDNHSLPWDSVAFLLNDMASRGVISREKLGSFYMPVYGPSEKEFRDIVEDERSFEIGKMQVHEIMSGVDRGSITPKMMALTLRAVLEPMIVQHFGCSGEVVEEFGRTVERHMIIGSPQVVSFPTSMIFMCVSLTKKI